MEHKSPETQDIQQGDILLADPSLRGGAFHKSVVLVVQHSNAGAFGLILNQPSTHKVGDFMQDEAHASLAHIPLYVGGPVEREHVTFVSFSLSSQKELRFAIRISAEEAVAQCRKPGVIVRAFTGYSGWAAGQLEDELERESWVPSPTPENFLGMNHDQSLWSDTLQDLSPFHRLLTLCPEQPELN